VSPCCAMGFACGREERGRGVVGRRGPFSPRVLHLSRSSSCGPGCARARARARDGRGRREGTWRAGRRRAGAGERGGESVALAPVAGRRKLAERPRPVCRPPPSVSACAAKAGTARGRRAPAGTSTAVEDRALRVELGKRCEVMWRARRSRRGAATGGALLEVHTASCTRVRVREGATRACGVPARRASSTRVEGEEPEVWG
jgi:hypothetical protein